MSPLTSGHDFQQRAIKKHVFKDNNADLLRIKRVKKIALEYILGSIYTSN